MHYIRWSRLHRNALTAALVVLATWPVAAQTQRGGAEQQWVALTGQVVDAQKAGDYAQGVKLAEEALRLARRTFGDRAPQTLGSLNNLAAFYVGQGRYGEAEPLYREALRAMREVLGARHQSTLQSLNNLAVVYYQQGRYGEAEPLFRETLQARREMLGPRHPDTLQGLNNLANLYERTGRYGEAEPLLREALQTNRDVQGARHPDTLACLNNLANLYSSQGRYGEAEPLLREALQTRREVLGPRHPDTLQSLNNLAILYTEQGRYGEAEPLYREAVQASRETLGARHPGTLAGLNNFALLYEKQGRHDEAEPLFREALQARRETLGARHPDTLTSLGSLASLYVNQSRYGEAEPLLREALQAMRETLGTRHPDTLKSINNLAALYYHQGRYGEAEPLFREALQASREVLGPHHPDTLLSFNSMAVVYFAEGRYGEAEPLFREALQTSREALGPRHPDTLNYQLNLAQNLIDLDRRIEAVRLLQQMEPDVLGWIGRELNSTEAGAARRLLVSSQANFQDVVMTLAVAPRRSGDEQRLAARVMLRFKLVQGEEEGYLARIARRSQDPRVKVLADDVIKLRTALSAAAQAEPGAFDKALRALEAKQHELRDVSRDYKDYLRVQAGNLNDVRAALPSGAVLIEFRQYRPNDFRTGKLSEPHFAAMLLAGFEEPVVADLGPVSDLHLPPRSLTDTNASAAYQKLFAPFEQKIAAARAVYVAPDGILDLVPFAQLKLADGRYWGERQEVRVLQTGRDLLHPQATSEAPARGLLALGGIDFKANLAKTDTSGTIFPAAAAGNQATAITRAADTFRSGFPALPGTADEATAITGLYRQMRTDEPAEMWSGADASKARLLALMSPPRVLHLATHGFYLPNNANEPMLQAGIALSGANRQLAGKGADGILFALEAQGLNLDGTELVVLSACDTAQGDVDYSEGVFGLARALRIAGARNVVVTLWELNDGAARDFMVAFYRNWLGQSRSDPAQALRETQLAWIKDDRLGDPALWAPYMVIE